MIRNRVVSLIMLITIPLVAVHPYAIVDPSIITTPMTPGSLVQGFSPTQEPKQCLCGALAGNRKALIIHLFKKNAAFERPRPRLHFMVHSSDSCFCVTFLLQPQARNHFGQLDMAESDLCVLHFASFSSY